MDRAAPLVKTEDLTKTYGPKSAGRGVRALDGLDLSLSPGTIGLVGANGAGKSTLFRILLGLTRPDHGSVEVAGIDVATDPVGVRSRLGFMPEHDCLPTDQSAADIVSTLGEIAGLPARAARQRASDVLDLVGLDEARFRPIEGFSTGMRQRTKLAQALVADPTLVLLDEPTAGLDPAGRHEMLDLIRRLDGFGISVIIATHLLDDVQATCDQVVMIDAGRLVASGRTADLLETTGRVRVDVGGRGAELMTAIEADHTTDTGGAGSRLADSATLASDGTVELAISADDQVAHVVGLVHRAGLPLHSLSTGRRTLDDVFLDSARTRSQLDSQAPAVES